MGQHMPHGGFLLVYARRRLQSGGGNLPPDVLAAAKGGACRGRTIEEAGLHHRTRTGSAGAHRTGGTGAGPVKTLLFAACWAWACAPDIPTDPVPAVAEFDPSASPPRVSEPSLTVINPVSGRIDLGLAGIVVPPDCADPTVTARAACEFNQYLQSLDGFPTIYPAKTPLSEAPDPATLVPTNIAVVDGRSGLPLAGAAVGFDPGARALTVVPAGGSWPVGAFVWIGVRGYEAGIRAADRRQVVASPVFHLLRQEQSLLCGATAPAEIPPTCPFFALLAQQMPPAQVGMSLFQLEVLRRTMVALQAWEVMAAAGGLARPDLVILWGFPVHSAPVIELLPAAGKRPTLIGPQQVALAVNGLLDPATVTAFSPGMPGTVYLVNTTALAQGDLAGGFPAVTAAYANGQIVITSAAPLVPGAVYAIAVTQGVKNPAGVPLVPPPISVLLKSQGALVDAAGKSTVPSVPDAEAAALELGRRQLAAVLDDMAFRTSTGITRDQLAYLYASTLEGP